MQSCQLPWSPSALRRVSFLLFSAPSARSLLPLLVQHHPGPRCSTISAGSCHCILCVDQMTLSAARVSVYFCNGQQSDLSCLLTVCNMNVVQHNGLLKGCDWAAGRRGSSVLGAATSIRQKLLEEGMTAPSQRARLTGSSLWHRGGEKNREKDKQTREVSQRNRRCPCCQTAREELFADTVSDVVNKVVNQSSLGEIYSFAFTTRSQGGRCRTSEPQFLFTRQLLACGPCGCPLCSLGFSR